MAQDRSVQEHGNGVRVFISYSHVDESHKNSLLTHLAPLKRNGLLTAWHDRKILGGRNLDAEIDTNLKLADLVLLLVSPDFIESDYCYEKEMTFSLAEHKLRRKHVLPIIVRPCVWNECPFSSLKALPKDGMPVSKWANADEAWRDVVIGIREIIDDIHRQPLENAHVPTPHDGAPVLSASFRAFLSDTQIVFQHRNKLIITLDDLYVFPDLKVIDYELNTVDVITGSEGIVAALTTEAHILIYGAEQSGKTSLLKRYFAHLHQRGLVPLYVSGEAIKSSDTGPMCAEAIRGQYAGIDSGSYSALDRSKKACLVDDAHLLRLNRGAKHKFVDALKRDFGIVIFCADEDLRLREAEVEHLDKFKPYRLLPLGHVLRENLIDRWNSLGVEELIDDDHRVLANDNAKAAIDSVIAKNIVPPWPLFVLTLLQTLETVNPNEFRLTSYGQCYQYLIFQALERGKIKRTRFDAITNYLTELAFHIYRKGGFSIEHASMESFRQEYATKYLSPPREDILEILLDCHIIRLIDGRYQFAYKYTFYFYVAKYIAEQIDHGGSLDIISDLCKKMHHEKHGNILIFITHHTKSPRLFAHIQRHVFSIFQNHPEATLTKDNVAFLEHFIREIPELVIEQRNVEEERQRQLRTLDESERRNHGHRDIVEGEDGSSERDDRTILADVNQSIKSLELIGQILKNRYGSLPVPQLMEMSDSGYSVGLRFLEMFIQLSDAVKDDITGMIGKAIKEDLDADNEELEKQARNIFVALCLETILLVIQKMAFSMGSVELLPVYEEIERKKNNPAVRLINLAIRLKTQGELPRAEIEKAVEDAKGNIFYQRILQEIVIQHLYLRYVNYKDKQWISSKLGIKLASQSVAQQDRSQKLLKP